MISNVSVEDAPHEIGLENQDMVYIFLVKGLNLYHVELPLGGAVMFSYPNKHLAEWTTLCSLVFAFLLFLPCLCQLFAQEESTLAILEFDAYGIGQYEAQTLTDRLRNNIAEVGGYRLVDRGAMEEVLKEQGFQQTGCTSDECIVEVGKLLGVQYMLGGSIGKVGKTFTVSMRIIDVETSRITKTASYDMTGEVDELLTQGMREAAALILGIKEAAAPVVLALAALDISSTPAEAMVHLDGEERGTTPVELTDLLPNQSYGIGLSKPDYYSVDTTLALAPGSREELRFALRRHQGWLSVTGSPEGSRLFVNKEKIGLIPVSRFQYPTGEYDLMVKKPGYFPLTEEFMVTLDEEITLDIQLKRKSKGKAFLFSTFIPGTGQLYQGYSFRGLLFLAGGLAAAYLAQDGWTKFTHSQTQYEADRDLYNNTTSGDQAKFDALKTAAQASFDQMKADEKNLITMAGVLGAVWSINLLEVLF